LVAYYDKCNCRVVRLERDLHKGLHQ
jgi:hypothetical protein